MMLPVAAMPVKARVYGASTRSFFRRVDGVDAHAALTPLLAERTPMVLRPLKRVPAPRFLTGRPCARARSDG